MIKRKNKRKLNINLFLDGGPLNVAPAKPDYNAARQEMSSIMTTSETGSNSGGMGNALSGVVGNVLSGVAGSIAPASSSSPDSSPEMPSVNIESNAKNNKDLLSEFNSWDYQKDKTFKDFTSASGKDVLNAAISGAGSGASGGPIGMAVGAGIGALQSGISTLFARNKAKKQAATYNEELAKQEEARAMAFNNKVNSVNAQNTLNMKSNLYAEGGQLNTFNTGGTHEENPHNGIPLGVGSNGLPNRVEEGEVMYNDYVYSNRGSINKQLAKELNLPKKYIGSTFAKVAEDLSKQNKERPNDPITNKMIDKELNRLRGAQEVYNAKQQAMEQMMVPTPEEISAGNALSPVDPQMDPQMMQQAMTQEQAGMNSFSEGGWTDFEFNPNLQQQTNPYSLASYNNNSGYGLSDFNAGKQYVQFQNNPNTTTKKKNPNLEGSWDTWLRYVPAIGSLGGAIASMAGAGKPDYSGADNILNAVGERGDIEYKPIADYMQYNPMDTQYLFSRAASNNAATRRAIRENSGGNRGASQLALLAADQNYNNSLAEIGRQADNYNFDKQHAVAQFNRGTNMFNRQQEMSAQQYNAGADQTMLNAVMQAEQLKAAERARYNNEKASNVNTFLNNIGGIGQEAFARNMIRSNPALLYQMGLLGNVNYKTPIG